MRVLVLAFFFCTAAFAAVIFFVTANAGAGAVAVSSFILLSVVMVAVLMCAGCVVLLSCVVSSVLTGINVGDGVQCQVWVMMRWYAKNLLVGSIVCRTIYGV